MNGETPTSGPPSDGSNDVGGMLDRAAKALSELVQGTDSAIADLRSDLGRRRSSGASEGDEESELIEAVLQRTEAARTETLGLVAILRRARAGLATKSQEGRPLDVGEIAPIGDLDASAAAPEASLASVTPISSATAETLAAGDAIEAKPGIDAEVLVGGEPATEEVPESDSKDVSGDEAPSEAGEGALLLATQMAVAGSSRDDIERCLAEFGVQDTRIVLEKVFGY